MPQVKDAMKLALLSGGIVLGGRITRILFMKHVTLTVTAKVTLTVAGTATAAAATKSAIATEAMKSATDSSKLHEQSKPPTRELPPLVSAVATAKSID